MIEKCTTREENVSVGAPAETTWLTTVVPSHPTSAGPMQLETRASLLTSSFHSSRKA